MSLTTYLNILLLFLAYCDSGKTVSGTRVVMCLSVLDFIGAVLGPFTPCCNTFAKELKNFEKCSYLLTPYEIVLLVLGMLAYTVNVHMMKLTKAISPKMFKTTCVFYHCLALIFSLVLVTTLVPVDLTIPVLYRSIIHNTKLRGVFFLLDGTIVYGAGIMHIDGQKQYDKIWYV